VSTQFQIAEYKSLVRLTWAKIEAAGEQPNQLFHKRLAELDQTVAGYFKGEFFSCLLFLFLMPVSFDWRSKTSEWPIRTCFSSFVLWLCFFNILLIELNLGRVFTDSVQSELGGLPFFSLIRTTVEKLDDFDSLVPVLQGAGRVQRKYGFL
jgi:hypothetical protein